MAWLDYVNPLQGTASYMNYSNGNCLPLTARPFGMAAWSPQTNEAGGGWFFHPSHRLFEGMRLTHQPSPWMGDYGHLTLLPQSGAPFLSAGTRGSSFRPDDMVVKPDYFRIKLLRYQTELELTPTVRCAALRLRYHRPEETSRLVLAPFDGESSVRIVPAERKVTGYTRANSHGAPASFALYYTLEFDCDVDAVQSGVFDRSYEPTAAWSGEGDRVGASIVLARPESGVVNVRIGTSFISLGQAERNLRAEIGERSFDEVRAEAAEVWERTLGRIEAEDEDRSKLDTFYTCLYRTSLFPRVWYEYDESGAMKHYSPYDGRIHDGPLYSDNGYWDTYRTEYPLLSLVAPSVLGEILQGWVNVYKEGGWMPKWASPGERSIMPGTLIDAVFGDAAVKNIGGFDLETAYEGLRKHAMQEADTPALGRRGLSDYLRYGFLPSDRYHESVNNTLDYMYGDFCIAQIAAKLGKREDGELLTARSRGYVKLFDPQTGFMRGRLEAGGWTEPFDPIAWGGDYCEGGPWQCSWAVQHDVRGLAALAGGSDAFKRRLDELFRMAPDFKIGAYPVEIHEMTEMAAIDFGQFALCNQPSFHIPYLYTAIGYPAGAQYWVRRAMEELFSAGPDGFPGDEDNGSMSAWYVFGALGMYPLCPGVPEYVIGSPLFARVCIHLENGKQIRIEAADNSLDNKYVRSTRLNGDLHPRLYFTHEELAAGADIRFEMCDAPSEQPYPASALPYSLSAAGEAGERI